MTFMPLASEYKLWLIQFQQKSRLETHQVILLIPISLSLVLVHCNYYQWVIVWLCQTLLYLKPHRILMLEHDGLKQKLPPLYFLSLPFSHFSLHPLNPQPSTLNPSVLQFCN